ncbi:MAG TPA: hypothetical protein VFK02_09270, partial [Kofleriaceae bacterium]|nr:hypothetical protein [Kofleriaceae bacterium]
MNEPDITLRRPLVLVVAAFVGLACALLGGPAGSVAAVWNGILLALAWHVATYPRAAPLGTLGAFGTLGSLALAAIYALAARATFGGSDPEDVDRLASLQLGVVAMGCAAVGVTCAAVWLVRGARR